MNAVRLDQNSGALKRVKSFEVKKLFGLYDHCVNLFLRDRVTIIHGPNGVGKTTLLRLLHGIFSQDFALLLSTPFDSIDVKLDDGSSLQVARNKEPQSEEERDGRPWGQVSITYSEGEQVSPPQGFIISASDLDFEKWASQHESNVPWIHRMGGGRWLDQRTDSVLTSYELWVAHTFESGDRSLGMAKSTIPANYVRLVKSVNTYLVEAQRLVRVTPPSKKRWTGFNTLSVTSAVAYDAQDLVTRVTDSFTEYGRISQSLDQTFPQRLFEYRSALSNDEIAESIKSIELERARLRSVGILDEVAPYPFDISKIDAADPARLSAISLYITDSKLKLEVLSKLAARVDPMLKSINSKFRNKRLQLDRDRGLVAKINGGGDLKPDQLSSGEQHEIVLLYNLLFRISANTLVLIDEPELSLHIEWQRRVLPELLEITANAGIDALIATHSPSIVGERDDLMVELDDVRDDIRDDVKDEVRDDVGADVAGKR